MFDETEKLRIENEGKQKKIHELESNKERIAELERKMDGISELLQNAVKKED